jgi:hypothetical protein
MGKWSNKKPDGTDAEGVNLPPEASVPSADVTEVAADAPVSPSETLLGTADVAQGTSGSASGEPAASPEEMISASPPAPTVVASSALGADKVPVSEQDPIFGTQPAAAAVPAITPDDGLPVQTDRPSYAKLIAAALRHESITIRQIRARPSNQIMVGGIIVTRELKTVPLDSVIDRGRGAIRDLAEDDTIEVYLVPEA